jgi:2-polyprenyl-3-methyl-5-hydroxy-6-metoxy-1,4-benzoquinol methylase
LLKTLWTGAGGWADKQSDQAGWRNIQLRWETAMTRLDEYSLGYRQAELERLQRQAEQLGGESARLFDGLGITDGARVLEIGCGPRGCLDLLAARVGVTGHVVGVELNPELAALAQAFVAANGIHNVDILAGDACSVGLDEASFDLVTSRLVLVNIPQPEQVIAAAVALARPGGGSLFTRWIGQHSYVIRPRRRGPPSSNCS